MAMGRKIIIGLLGLVWLVLAGPVLADSKRLALVIGNSAYQYDAELPNPANDAADLARELRSVGFEVVEGTDLTKSAMEHTIRDFAGRLNNAEAAMIFYAGHGLQIDGKNYLLPIDAHIEELRDVWLQAVDLDIIFKVIEGENRVNLIFLDACRNNAFAQTLLNLGGASRGRGTRGLAQVRTAIGSLIAFATEPGNVASDGEGRNSPFTTALLRHIKTPGLEVRSMLSRVRQDVVDLTGGQQVPWDHSSLVGSFYFNPNAPAKTAAPAAPAGAAQSTPGIEIAYWNAVKDTTDPKELESYLTRWPNGSFAPLAKGRLARLTPATPDSARTQTAAQSETPAARQFYARKNANVRQGPTTQSARIGAVTRGAAVAVTAAEVQPNWHRVRLPDGRTGYIYAPLLQDTPAPTVQVAVNAPAAAPSSATAKRAASPVKTARIMRPLGRWKAVQDGCFFDGYDYATVYIVVEVKGNAVAARLEVHDHGVIEVSNLTGLLKPDGSFSIRDSKWQEEFSGRVSSSGRPEGLKFSDCRHFSLRELT